MGDVVEVDFTKRRSFHREMDSIVDSLVKCLRTHYGNDAGDLMASAFSVCLDEIAVRVTKQLELRVSEDELDVLFTPEDGETGILFTPDFKLC
jgi:hypothetical protein|tara:strand:- start:1620 stop:1898 length:279 start_codon:yes stop_codon:yes gene_type:complete